MLATQRAGKTQEAQCRVCVNCTLRGYSINESEFVYAVNLDSDSSGKSNTTVTYMTLLGQALTRESSTG